MSNELDNGPFVREFRTRWPDFQSFISRFPTHGWLATIAELERSAGTGTLDEHLEILASQSTAGIRAAIADAAIRFSNNHRGSGFPSFADYDQAKSLWVGTDYKFFQTFDAGDHFFAMASMASEQFPSRINNAHLLARAKIVFTPFQERLEQISGLPLETLLSVGFTLMAARQPPGGVILSRGNAVNNSLAWMTEESVGKFLQLYMADYRRYRQAAAEAGVERRARYGFRPILRYPIVEIQTDRFVIPVETLLYRALSEGLYFLLLDSYTTKREKDQFFSDFGNAFEAYVRILFQKAGHTLLDLTTDEPITGARAEFTIRSSTDDVLALEAKKFMLLRDTFVNVRSYDLDKLLGRLAEAFWQVENTLNQVSHLGSRFGLVVTYGTIPFANAAEIRERIKANATKEYPTTAPDYIRIVDADEIELLTACPPSKFWEIVREYDEKPEGERGNLRNTLVEMGETRSLRNPWLLEIYAEVFEKSMGLKFDRTRMLSRSKER